jgi:hypothetical protein
MAFVLTELTVVPSVLGEVSGTCLPLSRLAYQARLDPSSSLSRVKTKEMLWKEEEVVMDLMTWCLARDLGSLDGPRWLLGLC